MNPKEPTPKPSVDERIDERAERVKQATSQAVASTKDKVDRAPDRVEQGLHHATDKTASAAHRTVDKAAEVKASGVVTPEAFDKAGVWMFRAAGGRFGDFRDWESIDAWAREIAEELTDSETLG